MLARMPARSSAACSLLAGPALVLLMASVWLGVAVVTAEEDKLECSAEDPQTCEGVAQAHAGAYFHFMGFRVTGPRITLAAMTLGIAAFVYRMVHIDDAPEWVLRLFAWPLGVPLENFIAQKPSRVLKYTLDSYIFTRPDAKLLMLSTFTTLLIVYGGVCLFVLNGGIRGVVEEGKPPLSETLWAAAEGAGIGWSFFESDDTIVRIISLLIALGGSFITALLFGIVTDAIGEKVEEMKSGRGPVLETNHLLILGWSEKIFSLLDQLSLGLEGEHRAKIVIMSEMKRNDMEEAFEHKGIDMKGSTVAFREGSMINVPDLQNVSAQHARSILILADVGNENSDARTLRSIMCLFKTPKAGEQCKANIIAEVTDSDQEDLLMQLAGQQNIRCVCSPGLVSRLMVQCTRYPKLTDVLQEMLGFEGNEAYTSADTDPLVGLPFKLLQACYDDAIPFGLKKQKTGGILLNPGANEVVEKGDEVILVAEDDAGLKLCGEDTLQALHAKWEAQRLQKAAPVLQFKSYKQWRRYQADSLMQSEAQDLLQPKPKKGAEQGGESKFEGRFLFIGWRKDIETLIWQLDNFCTGHSELFLFSDTPLKERKDALSLKGIESGMGPGQSGFKNITIRYDESWLVGDPNTKRHLEMLYPLEFDAIMLLAEPDDPQTTNVSDCDSKALLILLNLRKIQMDDIQYGRKAPASHPMFRQPDASFSSPSLGMLNEEDNRRKAAEAALAGPDTFGEGAEGALSKDMHPGQIGQVGISLLQIAIKIKKNRESFKEFLLQGGKVAEEGEEPDEKSMLLAKPQYEAVTQDEENDMKDLMEARERSTIVIELLDKSASELMAGFELSVKVLPHFLVSQIMALTMLSMERLDCLEHLLHPTGNKLFIRPVSWMLTAEDQDVTVSFLELSELACSQGEVLLGYVDKAGTVKLNPANKREPNLTMDDIESVVTISAAERQGSGNRR